jgi:uncharacterized protein (TIGR03663 family)
MTRRRRRATGRAKSIGITEPAESATPSNEGAPAGAADGDAPPGAPRAELQSADRLAWVAFLERHYLLIGLVIVAVAALLRLFDLGATPMHSDEGVNGHFVTQLVRNGAWTYDPANYHGPTLFYLALAAEIFFGLTTEAMRLVPALFGIATVALALALRPFVGAISSLVAAALLALSPGMTYISRYFIHEMLLVFFTLAIVVSLLWYVRDGRERFLLVSAASLAGVFATKETGVISLIVLAIALVVADQYVKLRVAEQQPPSTGRRRRRNAVDAQQGWRSMWESRFTPERLITASLVFAVVHIVLFTSFGSNLQGLVDSFATFAIWTQTSAETQTQPIYQYLAWMARPEIHILVLGTLGGLLVARQGRDRIAVFIGLWALGITMAYSLISYKTPWVAVNMIVPLAILGGIFVQFLVINLRSMRLKVLAATGVVGLVAAGAYQTVDLSFHRGDDETYGYVIVHTVRDVYDLMAEAERVSALAGGERNGISVFLPEYWPLPWYWRDRANALFWGSIIPSTDEAVIVANVNQDEAITTDYGDRYVRGTEYPLRPGVRTVLWIRSDLAGR